MKNLVSVKSYPVVVETWESKVTKTCHLLREALFRALTDSMYKNVHRGAHVSGSRNLEVEELLYLLVFVWNPRSEVRPCMKKR